jgi:putative phosphoribosyl transferase
MADDLLPFLDRTDAGKQLVNALRKYDKAKDTVVVGLLRGGVETAKVVTQTLHLPFIPYAVRKIGHPANPEFGLGAIAQGGGTYLDEETMLMEGVSFEDIDVIVDQEMEELRRRKTLFTANTDSLSLANKHVIIIDDGAATGATILAVIEDMRAAKVKRITVALPVCPAETVQELKNAADSVIALATPSPFLAVGQWYITFPQLSDEDVLRLLDTSSKK